MGCFFACFKTTMHRKRKQLVNVTHFEKQIHDEPSEVLQVTEWIKQAETGKPVLESKEKPEEPSSCGTEKKVTFDLNVKTYEGLSAEEVNVTDNLVETNKKKESEKVEETPKEIKLDSYSSTQKEISHLPNYRYQNCASSEDEIEDLSLEESDLDGSTSDSDNKKLVQEESSESLFSLSIDSRKQVCEVELGEKEVNSPMPIHPANQELEKIGLSRDRSQFVRSVLHPVENLTQWKMVKARATPPPSKYHDKENIRLVQDHDMPSCPETNVKLSTCNAKLNSNDKTDVVEQEITVDTSLSSWLVEYDTTPMSKISTVSVGNSPSTNTDSSRNHEDKPILGAMKVEELKQLSASTSPRWLRSRSPEEPVIGTVGSYWKHTGKIIDSDSSSSGLGMPKTRSQNSEDKRMKLHSISLEARLEKTLEIGVAEV